MASGYPAPPGLSAPGACSAAACMPFVTGLDAK
jgi:hypothetical protein